jgi:hypothetical protein
MLKLLARAVWNESRLVMVAARVIRRVDSAPRRPRSWRKTTDERKKRGEEGGSRASWELSATC